jgi:diguanylate cyclase (GGDEF)-like protein/PAS domain S-box-containing protein
MSHHPGREHLLAAILEAEEDGVLSVALDGTIESWSRGAEHLYGFTAEEMTGQPLRRLVPLYELQALETALSQARGDQFRVCEITERFHKNGSTILLTLKRGLIRSDKGEIEGILESGRALNCSGRLALAEAPLRLLIEQMPVLLWTTDRQLRITSNWGSGLPFSRIRPGALRGQTVCEFLRGTGRHSTPVAEHYDALRGISSHFEFKRKNRVLEIRVEPLRASSAEIIGCLGLAVDVTDRKESEEQTFFQARHDALTGLANYREFTETLESELRRVERSHRSLSLLLLDLDGLKRINDLQGHLAGNRALKRLAAALKEHCRSTDLAARYGGDEFALLLIDSVAGMAEQVAERIGSCLRNDRQDPPLSVNIGFGVYPQHGRTAQALLETADRKLYQQKKSSRHHLAASS